MQSATEIKSAIKVMMKEKFPQIGKISLRKNSQSNKVREIVTLTLPRADFDWNDEYRTLLDTICKELSEMGLRWSAEYPQQNALIAHNDSGKPWMLFNCGCAIDVETHASQQKRFGDQH